MADFCARCGSDMEGRVRFCLNCGEHKHSEGIGGLIHKYYDLQEPLKRSITGTVYRAMDTQLNIPVVLKKSISSKTEFDELEAEKVRFKARILELARLSHQGLPEIIDSFIIKDSTTQQSCYFVVRDYLDGKDLDELMEERDNAPFPVDEALDYFKQMLEIFNYLHKRVPPAQFRNVIASNFIIQKDRLYFVDFGISQVLGDSKKRLVISGYAVPGQDRNLTAVERDLLSIASIIYFLLTGSTPQESGRKSMRRLNPNVPEHFDRLIMAMLDFVADDRPVSVEEVCCRLSRPIENYSHSSQGALEEETIFSLIEKNDIAAIEEHLCHGGDVNSCDIGGDTLLFRALFEGREEIASLLIEKGAEIAMVESIGSTPLHWAVSMDMKKATSLLIQKGADPAAVDSTGSTPLHIAAARNLGAMAEFLIREGAPVNATDNNRCTPLHNAAIQGSLEVASLLVSHGAEIRARDRSGNTPLHKAAYLLEWALQKDHGKVGELLLARGAQADEPNEQGRTPLHEAAQSNHLAFVEMLLEKGSPVNARDDEGRTALMEAVFNGHYEVADYLVGKGADVNEPDKKGNTPLHWASYKGFLRLVSVLVEHGAALNAEDLHGDSPLFLAEQARRQDIVSYLISRGARHNIRDRAMKRIYGSPRGERPGYE